LLPHVLNFGIVIPLCWLIRVCSYCQCQHKFGTIVWCSKLCIWRWRSYEKWRHI